MSDCSLVNNAAPGASFGQMGIATYSSSTTRCTLSIEGGITIYSPSQSYKVTVTAASGLANAIGVTAGTLSAGGSGQVASLSNCRYQDPAKATTTYTFVAPTSGTVVISAICGRKDTQEMNSAPKITLTAGVPVPTKAPAPTIPSPTKVPITLCGYTNRRSCRADAQCQWKRGACVYFDCSTFTTRRSCVSNEKCDWEDGSCVPDTD